MQYILFVHPANTKSSHPHSICQANTNINTKNTNTMQCILFVNPILRPLTHPAQRANANTNTNTKKYKYKIDERTSKASCLCQKQIQILIQKIQIQCNASCL